MPWRFGPERSTARRLRHAHAPRPIGPTPDLLPWRRPASSGSTSFTSSRMQGTSRRNLKAQKIRSPKIRSSREITNAQDDVADRGCRTGAAGAGGHLRCRGANPHHAGHLCGGRRRRQRHAVRGAVGPIAADRHRQCGARRRDPRCRAHHAGRERRKTHPDRQPDHNPLARRPLRRHGGTRQAHTDPAFHRPRRQCAAEPRGR